MLKDSYDISHVEFQEDLNTHQKNEFGKENNLHVSMPVHHVFETMPHNSDTIDDHSLRSIHDKEYSIGTFDLDLNKQVVVDAMVKTLDFYTITSQDIFMPTSNSYVLAIFVESHLSQATSKFSNVPNVKTMKKVLDSEGMKVTIAGFAGHADGV